MEKFKLLDIRKTKGLSQNQMAEKLCMDVSNYNRRESGQVRISIMEWEKIAKILDVPLHEIYEPEEKQMFLCRENASGNYQGINNIYAVPESLLDSQQKYIQKLEAEILELKNRLGEK